MAKEKLNLKYPIVVEGKYDKIKLSSIISSPILVLNGFSFFKDENVKMLLKQYSKVGIIVLTDSDTAGQFIRQRLKGIVDGNIINLYTKQIFGKEKRKTEFSKDGILGVEGIKENELYNLFLDYQSKEEKSRYMNPTRAFEDGISGAENSALLRKKLLKILNLPQNMTFKAMSDALNTLIDEDLYKTALQKSKGM
ncbi:MAG: DUF4093 domain-containing protein [Clostridia bacterium]